MYMCTILRKQTICQFVAGILVKQTFIFSIIIRYQRIDLTVKLIVMKEIMKFNKSQLICFCRVLQ